MAEETFEKLLAILEGPATNTSFRMSDARRAVLIQALRIAIDSGNAVAALRPKPVTFDLSKLAFSEKQLVKQLQQGNLVIWSNDVEAFPHKRVIEFGLAAAAPYGDRTSELTITDKGRGAR